MKKILIGISILLLGWCLASCKNGESTGQPPIDGGTPDADSDTDADADSDTDTDADADSDTDADADSDTDAEEEIDCSNLAALPLKFSVLTGFSGAEDFAFDAQGNLVSVDESGNVTKKPMEGSPTLFVPNLTYEAAGTHFLPNGNLVVASVEDGTLLLIKPDSSYKVLHSGLNYPNGVEVDSDGTIYVAEHNAGQIREVNSETGSSKVIAKNLFNPNGLAFGPGFETLYVGSFGGGTVHKIKRNGSDWHTPQLFGTVPGVDGNTDFDEENGGLDGIAVDACGYVYVTVYIQGKIWRFSPDGQTVEMAANLNSSWIPNLHWGVGIGGFEKNSIYVMQRDEEKLFKIDLGIPSPADVFP